MFSIHSLSDIYGFSWNRLSCLTHYQRSFESNGYPRSEVEIYLLYHIYIPGGHIDWDRFKDLQK